MTKKLSRFAFALLLLPTLFIQTAHARAERDYAEEVEENIKFGREFNFSTEANGTFWHKGGKILVGYKEFEAGNRKCGDFVLKGSGHIFNKFKSELKHWARHNGYPGLAKLFRRREHASEFKVQLCYPVSTLQRASVDRRDDDRDDKDDNDDQASVEQNNQNVQILMAPQLNYGQQDDSQDESGD